MLYSCIKKDELYFQELIHVILEKSKFYQAVSLMTNSVSVNRPEKYNIAAFFSGVWGIELEFEQTNEFRVVYANEFDNLCVRFIS